MSLPQMNQTRDERGGELKGRVTSLGEKRKMGRPRHYSKRKKKR